MEEVQAAGFDAMVCARVPPALNLIINQLIK